MKKLEERFLKPSPGGKIRDPKTLKFLDEEGEFKPFNNYWRRRVKMNDVYEAKPVKKDKPFKKDEK